MLTIIGTKRGIRGSVWVGERLVGRAFAHSRVAAGTKGARRPFFTAVPHYPGCLLGSGMSLGTRFPSRRSAVRALRDFAREYPPERLAAMAMVESARGCYLDPLAAATMSAAGAFKTRHYNDHRPRTVVR